MGFLNWALGLQANGCEVVWLDAIEPYTSRETLDAMLSRLRAYIGPYQLADRIALTSLRDEPPLPADRGRNGGGSSSQHQV